MLETTEIESAADTGKQKQLIMEGQRVSVKTPLWLRVLLQEKKGAHKGGSTLYRLQWVKHTKTRRY